MNLPRIEVYDMLLFEEADGGIIQDCVIATTNETPDYYGVICNTIRFKVNAKTKEIYDIKNAVTLKSLEGYKLKEIWHKLNPYTFSKIWWN